MQPLISIALPCYNAGNTIVHCLQSILGQSYQNWELLAMDDGSTDDTLERLHSFDDPRIRIISDGVNRGRSYRLNQAALLAKGTYYARMDADDLMFSDRLEKQIGFLLQHGDTDLLGTGIISIGDDLIPGGQRHAPARITNPYRILKGEVLYHPTVTGRTSWFLKHPYNEDYQDSEDFALWAKSAGNLSLANLQEPLLFYREKGSFSYEKYQGRRKATRRALYAYAPEQVGQMRTHLLLLRRYAKDLVYALFYSSGIWNKALKLPNTSLDRAEACRYRKILEEILEKQV